MATITKAEFEALPDSLKPKFKADGDSFALVEEDVEGLKKSKAEILEEKKRVQAERDELAKFKADYDANQQKAKQADLEAKGEYEKALKEKEKAWKERFDSEQSERNTLLADVKRERLTNEAVKRGALPDRATYLVNDLDPETELVKGEDGRYQLKKKGGIGDADEFESLFASARESKPFFFAGTTQTGGGATGSGTGGNAKKITVEQYNSNFAQYSEAVGKGEIEVVG